MDLLDADVWSALLAIAIRSLLTLAVVKWGLIVAVIAGVLLLGMRSNRKKRVLEKAA